MKIYLSMATDIKTVHLSMVIDIMCFLGFALIISYIVSIIVKDKAAPQSISATVYSLSNNWKWYFTVVMYLTSFLILPRLLDCVSEDTQVLAFLSGAGLLGVGADPLCHGEKNITHYVSAVLFGVASQIMVILNAPYLMATWIPYIIYTLACEHGGKNMFCAEMSMLLNLALLCIVS